jgi:hypothetical protein
LKTKVRLYTRRKLITRKSIKFIVANILTSIILGHLKNQAVDNNAIIRNDPKQIIGQTR